MDADIEAIVNDMRWPEPCPDCAAGKHENCLGDTWNNVTDRPDVCPCWGAGHGEPHTHAVA